MLLQTEHTNHLSEWKLPTPHFCTENVSPSTLSPPPSLFVPVVVCLWPLFSSPEHLSFLTTPLSSQSSHPHLLVPSSSAICLPPPAALNPSLRTVTGNSASLPFCGGDKGGQCPLAGYVTGCHMRRTLWDGPVLSAVTTQITSMASHLISTSNSISGN